MAPSNPKRPPRPPRPPGASATKKEEVELPFDDDEVAPLQEDDPRPQRVPQFPAGPRRSPRGNQGPREISKDRELATRFDTREYSDPGYVLTFLYVEKGPGAGQLIPVKQGPLVIGRASVCDLRLQHPSISRRHAQLIRQGERFLLRDLGSQNGTFVNRVKLTADTEIRIGDEISLGNAILKLRGNAPSVTSDQVPQTPLPDRPPARKGMSLSRMALMAAAVGSVLAALVAVAWMKLSSPGPSASVPPESSAPPTDTSASTASPSQEPEAAYVPPPPASEEAEQAAPEQEEEEQAALKPSQPEEDAEAPASPKASTPRASASGAKSSRKSSSSKPSAKASPRQETPSEPSHASEKAPAEPPVSANREDVLALYEKGKVDAALNLAREGKLEPLAKQISDYQNAVASAQKALSARDTASAIRHLTAALDMDHALSQGWSVQGRKLLKQLGRLYTQTGQEYLKLGDPDAARESFELALQYDPENTWAKTELQQLKKQK